MVSIEYINANSYAFTVRFGADLQRHVVTLRTRQVVAPPDVVASLKLRVPLIYNHLWPRFGRLIEDIASDFGIEEREVEPEDALAYFRELEKQLEDLGVGL